MPRKLRLRDALRAKYRTPQEVLETLGLDQSLIDVKTLALDESERTKEEHEGKLGETKREEIGRIGSKTREHEPEGVFLEPASKKYPVKVKKGGVWKYDRGLLLAAAREARMHGHDDIASRADAIRKREFGEPKGSDMKPNRLQAYLVVGAARIFNPQLALDARDVNYAKLFDGVNTANLKARKPTIVSDAKKLLKGKTIAKDASVEALAHMLDQFEHVEEPKSLDESVSTEQHKAMEAAAHGHSNIGIPKEVGKEFSEADKGKHFDAIPEFLRQKGVDESVIKDCMDMLARGRDELPENALDEEEEEDEEKRERERREKEAKDRKARDAAEELDESECEDGRWTAEGFEEGGKFHPIRGAPGYSKSKAGDSHRGARDRKGAMDTVTIDEMNKAIASAVAAVNKAARETAEAREFVRPYVGELPMALDSGEKIYRAAAKALNIDDADSIHASALKTIIKMQPKAGAHEPTQTILAVDSISTAGFAERFPDAARIGTV